MSFPKVTPSAISPWLGTAVEGDCYTAEQRRTLALERPTWTWFTDLSVTLRYEPRIDGERWPDVTVQCPIIAWTKDRRRVLVVTPSGITQWADNKDAT